MRWISIISCLFFVLFCYFIQATFQQFDSVHAIVTGRDYLILKGITGYEPVLIAVCSMFSYKGGAWRESPTADDAIGFIYLFIYLLFFCVWRVFASFNHSVRCESKKIKNPLSAPSVAPLGSLWLLFHPDGKDTHSDIASTLSLSHPPSHILPHFPRFLFEAGGCVLVLCGAAFNCTVIHCA